MQNQIYYYYSLIVQNALAIPSRRQFNESHIFTIPILCNKGKIFWQFIRPPELSITYLLDALKKIFSFAKC